MNAKPLTGAGLHDIVLRLFDSLELKKEVKILDAGCGQGALLSKLGEKGYINLHGCDLDSSQLAFKKMKFKKTDLNKALPYPDRQFDVVFSIENIEHLENPWNLINEFHRVLKPGGVLILSTPNMHAWYQRVHYLLVSSFDGFETDPAKKYHIFPLFFWTLKKMIFGKFKILKVDFGRSVVPLLRVHVPFHNFFFSECYVVMMEKSR